MTHIVDVCSFRAVRILLVSEICKFVMNFARSELLNMALEMLHWKVLWQLAINLS